MSRFCKTYLMQPVPHTWIDLLNYKNRYLWSKPVTFRRYVREFVREGKPEIARDCQIDEVSIDKIFDLTIGEANKNIEDSSIDI